MYFGILASFAAMMSERGLKYALSFLSSQFSKTIRFKRPSIKLQSLVALKSYRQRLYGNSIKALVKLSLNSNGFSYLIDFNRIL